MLRSRLDILRSRDSEKFTYSEGALSGFISIISAVSVLSTSADLSMSCFFLSPVVFCLRVFSDEP